MSFNEQPRPSESEKSDRPLVWIADDEPRLLTLATATLELVADVETFERGEAVLVGLKDEAKKNPDIILLDNNMGASSLTGLQTAQEVTRMFQERQQMAPHIILVTARAGEITPHQLEQHGIPEMLSKPYSPMQLMQRVEAIHKARKAPPMQ